ncbi:hypothetical protein KEN51_CDS0349 [Pseudomonas phage vB_Pae10145-KEN51]|uniref:Uncharacterized protein n=2 Tax=Phikzvirus TaxID=680115 RepID=I7DP33_9CAUD|nr:hypothetical protein FDI90_gp311 [Pseudomonas phage PA7]ANM44852.1 hypothetical protein KTN4_094 [Pseudomonas phage KTN4]WNV49668.1 hypothetical protein [Pseudomonas phage ANB1]WNV50067.1 hypothetical protein [Pseudomonas phage PhiPizzaParty]BDR25161.1 hypothetical protein RVBP14_3270 [Pseudomonas phage sp. Brmt]AFO71118.1 hypothetical protein [Pseudomonas phage PA7]
MRLVIPDIEVLQKAISKNSANKKYSSTASCLINGDKQNG